MIDLQVRAIERHVAGAMVAGLEIGGDALLIRLDDSQVLWMQPLQLTRRASLELELCDAGHE